MTRAIVFSMSACAVPKVWSRAVSLPSWLRQQARTVVITNVVGSSLSREADAVLYTHAGPEIGVASTKAFTSQIVALTLLALKLGRVRGTIDDALLAQIIAGTLLMILSYTLTSPSENINWVFGPGSKPQRRLRPLVYVTMVIVSFPVLVYLPTHLVLARLFPIAR